jgi:hypothetical protein
MSSTEFSRWIAFYDKYPFLPERGDIHAAMIVAMLSAVNSEKGKYEPDKFMPKYGQPELPTEEDLLAVVEHLNASFGGIDRRE